MIKRIIIILLIIFSLFMIYSEDNTDDNNYESLYYLKNTKHILKYRGTLSFVLNYMPEYQDGIKPDNYFAPINYKPVDYTDKDDPDNKHHEKDDEGRIIGGTIGGTQFELYLDYHIIVPFFRANNLMMRDSNFKFGIHTQLSPITSNIGMSITFTPFPFLEFQTGFLIGFGWNIPNFAAGLGINNGYMNRLNIAGPHLQYWASLKFQIDLAYILPKNIQRWLHIIFIAIPKLRYMALLSVQQDIPYMYQECPGEKLGGWQFVAEILFGYRFIIIEDDTGEENRFININHKNFIITIGFYFWLDYLNLTHFWDSRMKDGGWGSDFSYINFGPAIQFDLPKNFFVRFAIFFCNDKAYTEDTVGNIDFRNRKYDDWYIYFKWIALNCGWKF